MSLLQSAGHSRLAVEVTEFSGLVCGAEGGCLFDVNQNDLMRNKTGGTLFDLLFL
jgi:hypothetical protein